MEGGGKGREGTPGGDGGADFPRASAGRRSRRESPARDSREIRRERGAELAREGRDAAKTIGTRGAAACVGPTRLGAPQRVRALRSPNPSTVSSPREHLARSRERILQGEALRVDATGRFRGSSQHCIAIGRCPGSVLGLADTVLPSPRSGTRRARRRSKEVSRPSRGRASRGPCEGARPRPSRSRTRRSSGYDCRGLFRAPADSTAGTARDAARKRVVALMARSECPSFDVDSNAIERILTRIRFAQGTRSIRACMCGTMDASLARADRKIELAFDDRRIEVAQAGVRPRVKRGVGPRWAAPAAARCPSEGSQR